MSQTHSTPQHTTQRTPQHTTQRSHPPKQAATTHPTRVYHVRLVGVNLCRINGAQHCPLGNGCEYPTGGILAVVAAVVGVCHTETKGRAQLRALAPGVTVVVGVVGTGHVACSTVGWVGGLVGGIEHACTCDVWLEGKGALWHCWLLLVPLVS